MSCKHPLKGFYTGELTKNGKDELIITSSLVHHIELMSDGSYERSNNSHVSDRCVRPLYKYIEIPCGNCIGCKLDYSRRWADRCLAEAKHYRPEQCWFITLTYDDENLPVKEYYNEEDGTVYFLSNLVKRDLQLFLKRLRFNSGQKFRYFACGEYGGKTKRSHYHLCVFGLNLDDLIYYKRSGLGDIYYNSPLIDKSWNKGYAVVAPLTWETCAYTARYCTKKLAKNAKEFFESAGLQPEFCLMSRKPGIGREFAEENAYELMRYRVVNVGTENGNKQIRSNRYFDSILEIEDKLLYDDMKAKSKEAAKNIKFAKLYKTSLTYLDYLKVEEASLLAKGKQLVRSLEDET